MTVDGVVRAVVVGLLVVGRDVGKLGSVGDSGLVTGVPWVPDCIRRPAPPPRARTPEPGDASSSTRLRSRRSRAGRDAPRPLGNKPCEASVDQFDKLSELGSSLG